MEEPEEANLPVGPGLAKLLVEMAEEANLSVGPGAVRVLVEEAKEVQLPVEEPSLGILPVGAAARTKVNIFSVGIPCLS